MAEVLLSLRNLWTRTAHEIVNQINERLWKTSKQESAFLCEKSQWASHTYAHRAGRAALSPILPVHQRRLLEHDPLDGVTQHEHPGELAPKFRQCREAAHGQLQRSVLCGSFPFLRWGMKLARTAAALSITTLYRSSLDTSKQAYSAGYATCLLDVLHFVEAGVSVSGNAGEEMTIGRVMDWVEARIEAIKSTEEEEEEEDRIKEGPTKVVRETQKDEREKRTRKAGGGGAAAGSAKIHRRSKENIHEATPNSTAAPPIPPARPPSASPPAPSLSSPSPPPPPARPTRSKRGLKDLGPAAPCGSDALQLPLAIPASAGFPFTFSTDVVSPFPITGSKRRHAAMISESPASSSVAVSSPGQGGGHSHAHHYGHSFAGGRRKRGRGARERERDAHHGQNANVNGSVQGQGYADAMEVEEDGGRERKRVMRR